MEHEIVPALRALYQSDSTAKQLFDRLAARNENAYETSADTIETLTGAYRTDAVALLRKLAGFGLGTYYIGRRGAFTRIQWKYDVRSVGKVAQGQTERLVPPAALDPLSNAEDAQWASDGAMSDVRAIEHIYQLRPDFQVRIQLPADFSGRDAERIGAWVRSLPFE